MHKTELTLILLLLIFLNGIQKIQAQDVDVYQHQKNSNFILPEIPANMTYKEFEILSTDLRMQDMMIAMIFPGHIHFKIKEKKTAYYILGSRLLGYAGWTYLSLTDNSLTGIVIEDNIGIDNDITTGDYIVAYGSLMLIVGSYLYDWIHGKYILDEKQNAIRYKYAKKKVKFGLGNIKIKRINYPALALTYNF
jgi:hypothetical protein